MNKLGRYLFRQTLFTTLMVLGAIAGLLLVTGIADEAARRVNETYTLADAVIYKLSTVISEVYDYIGVIVLLGTLITVASLNKHQELTIIQLTSKSTIGLVTTLLLPALLLLPSIYYAGEWLGPTLQQQAEKERALLRGRNLPTLQGKWYRAGNEFINVDFIGSDQELVGITRFQLSDQGELEKTTLSKNATYENGEWVLFDTQTITFSESAIEKSEHFRTAWAGELFTPDIIRNLAIEPNYLSLWQLLRQVQFRKDASTLTPELQRTLWSRVLFPIQYVGLLLVALSFAFGSFRQKTIGDAAFKGLVLGVLAGLLLDTTSAALMIIKLPAFAAVLISNLALVLAAGYFLKKRL